MLQPKSYPEMIGKALVLEGEPFIDMADDDDPWVEGLFLIVAIGLLAGLARFVGDLLLTVTLPPSNTMVEALIQGWRQVGDAIAPGMSAGAFETTIRQQWSFLATVAGFGGGWTRLFVFILVPALFLVQWLLYGLVGHWLARLMGGKANLNQTLGATALMVAPQTLLFFEAIPFVAVSGALIGVWSLLIVYRALQIAHELPWTKAIWAALLPPLVLLLIAGMAVTGTAILVAWAGG